VAALAGEDGATVKTESKSALIDMYRTDFFVRNEARRDKRKRALEYRADRNFIDLYP
jgi:hypothetical protein